MLFNYENGIYYKRATFFTEQNNIDVQVDIYLDKYAEVVEVDISYCGRGRGDVWTHPEIYEMTQEPFFVVVQKWINSYKEKRNAVSPDQIGRKESW